MQSALVSTAVNISSSPSTLLPYRRVASIRLSVILDSRRVHIREPPKRLNLCTGRVANPGRLSERGKIAECRAERESGSRGSREFMRIIHHALPASNLSIWIYFFVVCRTTSGSLFPFGRTQFQRPTLALLSVPRRTVHLDDSPSLTLLVTTLYLSPFADSPYPYASEIHDESFARRKQRRNRTTFTLQQVKTRISIRVRMRPSSE